MASNRIHGRNGSVEIASVALGSITKFSLSQPRDYVPVTSFGDLNKVYVPGLRDISGSIAFFYSINAGSPSAGDTEPLFDAAEGDVPVDLSLIPNTLDPTHLWEGPAYLDIASIDVDVNGAVNGTSSFKASGGWTRT